MWSVCCWMLWRMRAWTETNHLGGEVVGELVVLLRLGVDLLRLLVVVHGELLERLQHLLHLVLRRLDLHLLARHVVLQRLEVASLRRQQLLALQLLLLLTSGQQARDVSMAVRTAFAHIIYPKSLTTNSSPKALTMLKLIELL